MMEARDIIRNILTGTIPLAAILFAIVFAISRNIFISAAFSLAVIASSVYSNIGKYLQDAKKEHAGVTKHGFRAHRVFELIGHVDLGPALCFDTGGDKYLLINGQWIFDEDVYDIKARDFLDSESGYFNGYSGPYSFPSTEFEIWTSNLDGEPVRINVLGKYLEPQMASTELPQEFISTKFALLDRGEINIR